MQFGGQGKPPVGVVFDCDMGTTVDDVLALALLYGLQGKNEIRVAGLSVSYPNLRAAEFADALARFYMGEPGPFSVNFAIGLHTASKMANETPMVAGLLDKKTPEGKPVYLHTIEKMNDTADPVALIRNALTAQYDQNGMVILAGAAMDTVKVLDLPGCRDLISRKVRYLTVAAGAYPSGQPEARILRDIPSAKRLFAEWPTPIVASGYEVGESLLYPGASIEKDFAWSPAHPVADAYRAYKPMPYDAPSWAMTAVLYAVRPMENYFKLSEPGTITVTDDGRTQFNPSAEGKHRYLIADPAQKDRIVQAYTEIASMKPVRPQRFRPQQKKQDDPPKK